jgi:hypothetical protein
MFDMPQEEERLLAVSIPLFRAKWASFFFKCFWRGRRCKILENACKPRVGLCLASLAPGCLWCTGDHGTTAYEDLVH